MGAAALSNDEIRALITCVTTEGLNHEAALAGLPPGVIASVRSKADLGAMMQQVHTLNRMGPLDDGTQPMGEYLRGLHYQLVIRARGTSPGARQIALWIERLEAGPAPMAWAADADTRAQLEQLTAGEPSLLDVSYLSVGAGHAEAVVCVQHPAPDGRTFTGSGFVVAPRWVLTCNHVAFPPGAPPPTTVRVRFFHELQANGQPRPERRLTGEVLPAWADRTRDWALIQLPEDAPAPPLRLAAPPVPPDVDQFAVIIQHPDGAPKKIALHRNLIRHVDRHRGILQYLTQTERGSSGAPVFDKHWSLIAMHTQAADHTYSDGRVEHRNQGVLVETILDRMRVCLPDVVQRELGL